MAALTGVPWVAVSLSDIQNARPGALVQAFQSTALAVGQGDPTTAIIQKCTTDLLSAIGYSGRVVMDASQGMVTPDVVPPNLFNDLVEEICRMLEKRLSMAWTPEEVNRDRDYRRILQSLMEGKYSVYATNNPGNLAAISSKGGAVASIPGVPRFFRPNPRFGFFGNGL